MNLRPSGYEPDELPDCSTPRKTRFKLPLVFLLSLICIVFGTVGHRLRRPGSDLLFHALRRSTIGAKGFHGRVRDGIGCRPLAITTRSSKTVTKYFSTLLLRQSTKSFSSIHGKLRVPLGSRDFPSSVVLYKSGIRSCGCA